MCCTSRLYEYKNLLYLCSAVRTKHGAQCASHSKTAPSTRYPHPITPHTPILPHHLFSHTLRNTRFCGSIDQTHSSSPPPEPNRSTHLPPSVQMPHVTHPAPARPPAQCPRADGPPQADDPQRAIKSESRRGYELSLSVQTLSSEYGAASSSFSLKLKSSEKACCYLYALKNKRVHLFLTHHAIILYRKGPSGADSCAGNRSET